MIEFAQIHEKSCFDKKLHWLIGSSQDTVIYGYDDKGDDILMGTPISF